MRVENLHTTIHFGAGGYFYAQADGAKDLCLILTGGKSRKPLKVCGITRQQWYNLATQVGKVFCHQDEYRAEAIIGVNGHVDEKSQNSACAPAALVL
jgi:hypothetical protein